MTMRQVIEQAVLKSKGCGTVVIEELQYRFGDACVLVHDEGVIYEFPLARVAVHVNCNNLVEKVVRRNVA